MALIMNSNNSVVAFDKVSTIAIGIASDVANAAENGHSNHLGSSIIGSMEINGILYQGVLFAQPPPTHLLD